MGNNSTKESRSPPASSITGSLRSSISPTSSTSPSPSHTLPDGRVVYASRSARTGRPELTLFGHASTLDRDGLGIEPRRETKQEREARKAERERIARALEREKSLKHESVDGGYLVTLGVYTGPEDFSKTAVRQLQIERRLAPFWRGLNDHSDSWTEHQLVAAARGKSIPAADEIPSRDTSPSPPPTPEQTPTTASNPISFRLHFDQAIGPSSSAPLSTSHPTPTTIGQQSSPPSLFRSRAKTLASVTPADSNTVPEVGPQELPLPKEPRVNGQPIEAYLYKDAQECPICFMYYPPYLNRTRCCDQSICSECFVQIKRPDPHPPEHTDPNSPLPESRDDESQLTSEPAACPFCVQSEFGVTYDPPPFRRGLAYAHQINNATFSKLVPPFAALPRTSPDSSGNPPFIRRRNVSISANAPTVITTDKVRPDWAKKLYDARSQAARRSAAATALHTAAYLAGGSGNSALSGLARRRRNGSDIIGSSGTPRLGGMTASHMEQLLAVLEGQESSRGQSRGNQDLLSTRISSRNNRAEDLEEMMMMEAIRLSLATEEDRKKKEEKESAKEAKKEDKKKAKDQKKADKAAKKMGSYSSSTNTSRIFGSAPGPSSPTTFGAAIDEGKGKEKIGNEDRPFGVTGGIRRTNSGLESDGPDHNVRQDAQNHLQDDKPNFEPNVSSFSAKHQPVHSDISTTATGTSLLETSTGITERNYAQLESSIHKVLRGQYDPTGTRIPLESPTMNQVVPLNPTHPNSLLDTDNNHASGLGYQDSMMPQIQHSKSPQTSINHRSTGEGEESN